MTRVLVLATLICRISSRQRPHGRTISEPQIATIVSISDSLALSISATAACSAQKPRLHVATPADQSRRNATSHTVAARPEFTNELARSLDQALVRHRISMNHLSAGRPNGCPRQVP
jgi:hypothetical protein